MMLAAFATQHPVLFTILAFPAVVTLCLILLAVSGVHLGKRS
jgi:hypothetical protein